MNNSLTGGGEKSSGGRLDLYVRRVCSVVQHCVWVIHHTNTAGGHSLAQRYAEQGENNVLRLHPLNLIEIHSTRRYIYSPPTWTLYKSTLGLYILLDNP